MKKLSQIQFLYFIVLTVLAFALCTPSRLFAQDEPVKRVLVTVTVKEKAAAEIVQLPATNLPLTINKANFNKRIAYRKGKPNGNFSTASNTKSVSKPIASTKSTTTLRPNMVAKAPVVAKAATAKTTTALKPVLAKATTVAKTASPVKNNSTAASSLKATPNAPATPPKVATPLKPMPAKPTVVAKTVTPTTNNSTKASSLKPQPTPNALKPANAEIATAQAKPAPAANSLKPSTDKTSPTAKVVDEVEKKGTKYVTIEDPSNPYVETIATTGKVDKQNTLSYVWIGSILIIAGLVLGLLFGRAAFLVSLVGVIFILLGVLVF